MTTYNEDVRDFVTARYEALAKASRDMRTLHDGQRYGKFTRRHTMAVADTIKAYLNEHFSTDSSLPDLSTWEGFNAPQRAYIAEGGAGLTMTPTVVSGVITAVTVTDRGSGYARPPIITVTDPNPLSIDGTGAGMVAVLGLVTDITVDEAGIGYDTIPTVTLSAPDDPNGMQATAIAVIVSGALNRFLMIEGGSGYGSPPTVTLSGGTPETAATGTATVDTGAVASVTISDGGTGYSSDTTLSTTPSVPVVPESTDAQMANDDYIPFGWTNLPLITNATNQRNVFRIERAGRIGAWEEWEAPTLWTIYDPNQG